MRIFFLTYFHLKMKIAILVIGSNAYKCFKMFNIWFFFLRKKSLKLGKNIILQNIVILILA